MCLCIPFHSVRNRIHFENHGAGNPFPNTGSKQRGLCIFRPVVIHRNDITMVNYGMYTNALPNRPVQTITYRGSSSKQPIVHSSSDNWEDEKVALTVQRQQNRSERIKVPGKTLRKAKQV
ncbi:hypothetical protein F5884DRAFT_751652 [Xylogone sp. PMI_703]|nr:hypothetical protein F5884DRAFT_751652 [Xylogone sp. PMI_703]